MLSLAFFAFTAVSTVLAFLNWRLGLLLCVVVGVLQDPIRKVTPGTPVYLTLCFVPIYAAMVVNLLSTRVAVRGFLKHYPEALAAAAILFGTLLISSAQTMAYGLEAGKAVLLGLLFYSGWVPALLLGFFFLRRSFEELDGPLILLAAVTALMLLGVPLEYLGVKFSQPWLGTVAMTGEWRRWYNNTEWVAMMSGFHRSPEIMGWHAALLVILAIYLLARRPALSVLWLVLASEGLVCVLLSGRRKMFLMLLAFAGLFALLSGRRRGVVVVYLVAAAVAVGLLSNFLVEDRYLDAARSSFTAANERAARHTLGGPLWLATLVGPFGYGVGTKSQGMQHLDLNIETPLVEGGFEKIMVELGLVGTFVVLAVGATLGRFGVRSFRRYWQTGRDVTPLAALAAFLLANGMTFLIAFQVYGDPLLGFLLGFTGGLALSGSRLAVQQSPNPSWQTATHSAS